jgi:hypothetical protein
MGTWEITHYRRYVDDICPNSPLVGLLQIHCKNARYEDYKKYQPATGFHNSPCQVKLVEIKMSLCSIKHEDTYSKGGIAPFILKPRTR